RISDRGEAANWESFFNILVERSEQAGIIILRSGKVGNNTHRTLDVKEFRGFVIYDELAPFIFINGADAKAAQIFTLVHELAHVWLGASGVSNNGLDTPEYRMNNT
ncbi:MAG TPA: ImmA/IrrE family metallo-endopeptidase, partial [Candidatus Rifleibacterium sp.]|nr:ImmA/IrrE family metallo-endopeptidase [Candidatus Rifleibacterium sp.]